MAKRCCRIYDFLIIDATAPFFCHGNGVPATEKAPQGTRPEYLWKRRIEHESDIYEREEDPAAGVVHVTAHGHLHGGQFPLQYCGQLLCGAAVGGLCTGSTSH